MRTRAILIFFVGTFWSANSLHSSTLSGMPVMKFWYKFRYVNSAILPIEGGNSIS